MKQIRRIVFLTALMLILSAFASMAAAPNAAWTKVKLTKKAVAHWNLELGEEARKKDIDHYELEVFVSGGGNGWQEWDTVETEDRTRHEKLAVTDAGTYKFRVRAVFPDGETTNWSPDSNEITITEEKAQKLNRKALKELKKAQKEARKAEREARKAEKEARKAEREERKAEREARKAEKASARAKKAVTNTDGSLKRGWELSDGVWKYYDKEGNEAVGWLYVRGHWYFLDEDGEMMTGWIRNDGKLYYLDESGAMATGEAEIEGEHHSFDVSGAKVDGKTVDEPEIEDTELSEVTIEPET